MKRLSFVVFFLLQTILCSAQISYADSLKYVLDRATNDTTRFIIVNKLSNFYEQTKPDSSLFYARQMIMIAEKADDTRIRSLSYSNYGHEQYILGNYPQALEMLFKALQLAERIGDSSLMANINNSIGNTYKEYEDYKRSIPYYLQCKLIAGKSNNTDNLLYALMNLGFVYERMNMPDSALFYEQQAFALETSHHVGRLDFILNALGSIHAKLDQPKLALEYFRAGIEAAKESGRSRYLCMNYLDLAIFFRNQNMRDSALFFGRQSLHVANELPYLKGIARAGKFLSGVYASVNQNDSAFHYQNLFVMANDGIYNRAQSAEVENLTFMEKLRKQEVDRLQIQADERRNQNLQYILTALGIVVFLFLFLILSRSIITNTRLIQFLGLLALLIVFEFLNLLLHPLLERITNHSPVFLLLTMVCIGALLVPLHHQLQIWATTKLVEKNKQVRLAAAKRTIEKLEKEEGKNK